MFVLPDAKVETSSLTGEAVPISLTSSSEEARMEEAHDVAFNTSQCLEGEVFGVVFATGDRSRTYVCLVYAAAEGKRKKELTNRCCNCPTCGLISGVRCWVYCRLLDVD